MVKYINSLKRNQYHYLILDTLNICIYATLRYTALQMRYTYFPLIFGKSLKINNATLRYIFLGDFPSRAHDVTSIISCFTQ